MGKEKGPPFATLSEAFDQVVFYFQYEFQKDLEYVLFQWVGPLLVTGLAIQGSLAVLRHIYRIVFPPGAKELHSSALAALHDHKRIKRKPELDQRVAEKLLLKALEKDDLYFPAYLTLASLYIYKMKQPDKALRILEQAKDRGPLKKLEPLLLDAEALKEGNEHMIRAGAIFQEYDYLTVNEYWGT